MTKFSWYGYEAQVDRKATRAYYAQSPDWDCSCGLPARCCDDYENFRDFPRNENENLRTNDRLRLCSLCPYTQPS